MSDNIKLVIEIPKDRYTDILRIADVQIVRRMPTLEQVVAHGIPLDDVNKDFPQAEDIKPTVENFSNLLDNKLIRDATSEERESVNNYIKSISTKTGIKFDDVKAEIKGKCDEINYIVSDLPYSKHRAIQELLCEILDNIGKAESEDKE